MCCEACEERVMVSLSAIRGKSFYHLAGWRKYVIRVGCNVTDRVMSEPKRSYMQGIVVINVGDIICASTDGF